MEGTEVYLQAFLISALDGGEWLSSCSNRFIPRERPPVPTGYEAGWAPELVSMWWRKRAIPALNGSRKHSVQPVA